MKPRRGLAICGCAATVLAGPAGAAAQLREIEPPLIPEVCRSEPPHLQPTCAEKQLLYATWVGQLGLGVVRHTLPDPARIALQPFFPNVPLSQWRFGYGPRQEPANATTDCDVTYFNDPAFVAELSQGRLKGDPDLHVWLAHEIRHFGQCIEVGDRDEYAKMWWDDLDAALLGSLLTSGQDGSVHDQMAMEADAISWGEDIGAALLDCCVHPGTLDFFFPPIEIEPGAVAASATLGETLSFDVELSGGAAPYIVTWSRWGPADPDYWAFSTSPSGQFVPRAPGPWKIRLAVRQVTHLCGPGEPDRLPCWAEEWEIDVLPPQVTAVTVDDATLDFGQSTTAHFTVEHLLQGADTTVRFSASDPLVSVTVPSDALVAGGPANEGTGSFTVDVGSMVLPLPRDRQIPIRAWVGDDPSLGASATITIPGLTIEDLDIVVGSPSRGDPMQREVYRVAVKLSRAVRVPVTIQLESSDPRTLEVPSTLTVEPGETTATLELLPAEGLRDTREVTVRAFHAQPDFAPREATVTVRGSGR